MQMQQEGKAMYRLAMRLAACTFAIVLCFCGTQSVKSYQRQAPFGADVSFSLNIVDSSAPKSQLARELAAIGEEHNALICKVSPDEKHYLTKTDIVLFSGSTDSEIGPSLDRDNIQWTDGDISGKLIDYEDMGSRTLNGSYCASNTAGLRDAIQQWAASRAIVIEWHALSGLTAPVLVGSMFANASGLLIPASMLFVAASVLFMAQKRWNTNRILLIGGVPYSRVRGSLAACAILSLLQGLLAGYLMFAIYVAIFAGGLAQLHIIASAILPTILPLSIIAAIAGSILGGAMVPSFESLHQRKASSLPIRILKSSLTVCSLLIVMAGIFFGCSLLENERMLLSQSSMYEQMASATRVSLRAIPSERNDGGISYAKEHIEKLIDEAERSNILLASIDVKQSMSLSASECEGFDSYVIVNRAYLDLLDIGIGKSGSGGSITQLEIGDVPETAIELTDLWGGDSANDNFSFWSYSGSGLLALGANISQGGRNVTYDNPLVILIEAPMSSLNYEGFTSAMLSTGNVFFSDYDTLDELISATGSREFIASIDRLFEVAQLYAQIASSRANVLLAAIIAACAVVISMAIQSALSWSSLNRERIFANRTSGKSYPRIVLNNMKRMICIGVALIFASAAIEIACQMRYVTLSVAVPLILYLSAQFIFRGIFSSTVFRSTIARKEA